MRIASLFSIFALALTAATIPALAPAQSQAPAQPKDKLTIYTYESFTAKWGPGPVVKQAFEAQCDCEVEFVGVADGVALLNRVKLEGESGKADIVVGLDNNLTSEAAKTGLFAPHGVDASSLTIPGGWSDATFLPFDYSYFAFVYDTETLSSPPTSMKDLVDGDASQKIIIQDPRTSTPGLGLLLWVKAIYGDEAPEAWEKLQKRVLTVTPGWSEAYGLFTKGEAPMVLSYTTSPAYHMIADKSERYQAASFSDGHYLQVEVAAMTKLGSKNPLSEKFMQFMISPGFQDAIPETNWMLPVAATSKPLDPAFDRLVKPVKSLELPSDEVAAQRKVWIDEWLNAMSR